MKGDSTIYKVLNYTVTVQGPTPVVVGRGNFFRLFINLICNWGMAEFSRGQGVLLHMGHGPPPPARSLHQLR